MHAAITGLSRKHTKPNAFDELPLQRAFHPSAAATSSEARHCCYREDKGVGSRVALCYGAGLLYLCKVERAGRLAGPCVERAGERLMWCGSAAPVSRRRAYHIAVVMCCRLSSQLIPNSPHGIHAVSHANVWPFSRVAVRWRTARPAVHANQARIAILDRVSRTLATLP